MKVLRKVMSIILLAAMLLSNSRSLVAYANEVMNESDLITKEKSEENKSEKATDITPPVIDLSSLKVNKDEVKPGDEINISLKITDDISRINYIYISYIKPMTGNMEDVKLSYNETNDTYEGSICIDENKESGLWQIYWIYIEDNSWNTTFIFNSNINSYGEIKEDLSAGNFNVSETNADTIPPEFKSISVDKKVVNPGDKVTVSIDMIDNQSGIDLDGEVYIELGGEKSNQLALPELTYNKESNKYEFTVEIDGTMPNGIYSISEIYIHDKAGNTSSFNSYGENPIDLSDANFEVVDSIDGYEKLIKSVKIDNKTPKVGDTINMSVELANNFYISNFNIYYYINIDEYQVINLKYNEANNRYEGELTIDEIIEPGVWSPEYI